MRAYRTKVAEPIEWPDREGREQRLREAGFNGFGLSASDVAVDLLTDSGTGAMSDAQWAALLRGDEAYAGSRSFEELREAVASVMGFHEVIPAHQGRGAENVLYGTLLAEGDVVPNNTHFDTTRAHVENQGARAVDCPVEGSADPDDPSPFKGNFDVERARETLEAVGRDRVSVVVQTITNNSVAGQPVHPENTRAVADLAAEVDATFVIDACRFAENAFLVRERDPAYADRSIAALAREQLDHADAIVMSGKKDGLVNVGGFVATDDPDLADACRQRAILYEGFPTYGGMAGRDLAAMAVGLEEAITERYVRDRVEQVAELAAMLADRDVPHYRPPGGHAVYLDAGAILPHVPAEQFPDQALTCELYLEGGVRGVALGRFAFPDTERPDLVRLAIPRRTYFLDHLEHVADTAAAVVDRATAVPGYRIVSEPDNPSLRHFTATLEPIE